MLFVIIGILTSNKITPANLSIVFSIGGTYLASIDSSWKYSEWTLFLNSDYYAYWLTRISSLVMILSSLSLMFFYNSPKSPSLNSAFYANFFLVVMFFSSIHMLYFYLIFEISVIPIFLMVTGWGYQPERLKASYAIIFYTMVSSVPLITCIITVMVINRLSQFNFLSSDQGFGSVRILIALFTRLGFIVKLPMYGVHLWLPLAHVEAPVYGSIILAGILLKLGGLGVIRLAPILSRSSCCNMFSIVSLVGTSLVGITCLKITDLKSVIAFSSVAHIGVVVIIILYGVKLFSWAGAFIILTHAFRSSSIFYGRYVIYIVRGTRNILLNKGGVALFPGFALCWLVAVMASIGTPPFINLASEVYSLFLRTNFLGSLSVFLVMIFMLGRCYHLIIYRSSQQEISRWDSSSLGFRVNRISIVVMHLHSIVLILCFILLIALGY